MSVHMYCDDKGMEYYMYVHYIDGTGVQIGLITSNAQS